jgi:predicted amidophosphoribosyltransferase
MSENPNPTVCGNCNTENPPGAEYCQECGEPLTLSAELAESEPGGLANPDVSLDSPEATDPTKNPFPTD